MGLGAVGDYLLGAAVVGLIFAVRRRLKLIPAIARSAGTLGTILALISVTIIVGGVLFELRCIPGPYFSLGAITAAVVIAVAVRWLGRGSGSGAITSGRLPFLRRPDAVIVLAVLAAMTGVALSIHTMWGLDVTEVYRLFERF